MNPYAILGIVVLWLASLVGAGYYEYHNGVTVTDDAYKSRDNIALTTANNRIVAIEEQYRHEVTEHANNLAAISGNYEKEKADEKLKSDNRVAAARAGVLRLYSHQTAGVSAIGSGVPNIATSTSGRDGSGDGRLSAGDSGFLLDLGGRCNAVRNKLTACQSIVVSDRVSKP